MANIQGGALEFDVLFNNGQINRAMEETKRRIQGFSDATVEGGSKMEAAYQSAARYIEKGFETIGNAISINETAIANLQKKYNELGAAAGEAFMKGNDNKYNNLKQQQDVVQKEINERKRLVSELTEQDAALLKHNQQLEEEKSKVDNASAAQTTFRTQLRKVTEQLAMLEEEGRAAGQSLSQIRGSEKFRELQQEAGRLTNAMGDARTQARILAHDNQGLQGVISAVQGVTGAFTIAQGAIGLFGDKNEDLQKIMLRVQSLMAITMGMQQVANALNKDSEMMIKLNTWWLGVKTKAQVTDTTAAVAGTAANAGLAGSFRLVGAAISSIPVFGWIAAAIGVLIGLISHFSSKAREAKKDTEEFYKSVAENASKPIASINKLSYEWEQLGDNLEAKQKFVKENKKSFDELGVSVIGVVDAENLLINNKSAFIEAQIAKAQANAMYAKSEKDINALVEAKQKLADAEKTPKVTRYQTTGMYGAGYSYQIDNPEIAKQQKEIDKLNAKIQESYGIAANYEQEGSDKLQNAKIESTNKIKEAAKGTIGALEQEISDKQAALKTIATSDKEAVKSQLKEIEVLQKQLDGLLGRKNKGSGTKKTEDPFTKGLEEKKKAYQEYFKWVNAGYQNEAKQEFSQLLEGGKSYLEYLKKMREDTNLTKEQIHQITNEISQETSKTILSEFEKSLQEQLNNAQTVLDMLNVIKKQREDLAKVTSDEDPLKEQKNEIIAKQEEDVVKKQEETTKQLIANYSDYLDKKIMLELELDSDLELLRRKRDKATTEADKKAIDAVIENRQKKYNEDKANLLNAGYEATRKIIDLGQDKALLNISKKTFTWEADRQVAIIKAQKEAAERTLKEMQKMQREAPTDEIAQDIEEIKLKIEELNAELAKMPNEKFQEMLSGLQKITGALGNLDGEVGEIFSSISSEIGNLQVAFDSTASKTDKISAGISSIVDIINMVTSASAERKRVEKEFYQNQIALAHEYALALNEQLRIQSELAGSGFVTNYMGKINDGFNALSNATKEYQEALNKLSEGKAKTSLRNAVDWGNVGKGAVSGLAAGAAIGSIVPVIGTAIGAVVGGIVGGLVGLFGGKKKKNEYSGLMEVFPELVDSAGNLNKELAKTLIDTKQVDENTRQLIQNALDWADAVEEANKQIKEVVVDLAGDLGNRLKNAMVEAWKAGEDGSKKMFEAASASLGKFIEDLLYSTIFSGVFKDFENDLVDSLNELGGGDMDIIDDYDRLMQKMEQLGPQYQALLESINERAKLYNMDFKGTQDGPQITSLSGAIKGASQESIDLLAGQTNAVRVNQVLSIEILNRQLLYLANIESKIGGQNDSTELIRQQLFHLANIDSNTHSIDINTKYIKDIYDKINSGGDSLRANGIVD
ncbi:MAG: hypothetical protein EZS26_000729 [Candidatus Ordinivivax streblomastigis]|uniref:Uncharacterized protein n=1 Tax=Candidatus Ordinivivax streblomastigis TaxID=2540710 RepID=A0A5M8P473_9BACT|nr:MAG: hypothetical protein EZS26_000729 [Candidatus Ordinivivax streblomastigis]